MDEHDRGQAAAVHRIPHRDAVGGHHLTDLSTKIIALSGERAHSDLMPACS